MDTCRRAIPSPADDWGPLPPHAIAGRPGVLAHLERVLYTVAAICLGSYVVVSVEACLYQAYEDRQLQAILASGPAEPLRAPDRAAPRTRPLPGSAIGRIEIPRLGVSVVIRAGSDAKTLRLAVGHIPGTALPGDAGNVGLAGHRDTFFRRLKDIRPNDEIRLTTPEGQFVYRVADTWVVDPHDVWVLQPTPRPSVTLVTCYPFRYIGHAPQRFIVRAELGGAARHGRS
ncbi:MAG TPA: class D sortase [Vicinamibacterales bacterium]|nr:class D sortase [Vicinamibacterales bacterium]